MRNDAVLVSLTRQEAVVLFDWLARENEPDKTQLRFDDRAEQQVLWSLEGKLEKLLDEQFAPNYRQIVADAREKVRDKQPG